MNRSFLQNHYNIEEAEYGYKFTTDKGVDYLITFVSYPSVNDFLSVETFMFNIERATLTDERTGQNDVKVRNTIFYILYLFFKNHHNALITLCDIYDGKQFARKRLFDFWFKRYNENFLVKIDGECMIEETTTFASLLFAAGNDQADGLKSNFYELIKLNFYS